MDQPKFGIEIHIIPLFFVFLDPPRLNRIHGLSMNAEFIDEGKDVYFMCEIKANP